MTHNDIISLLTKLLGTLKMQPQRNDANFDKFQDMLMKSLTQPSLEFRKSGVEFPGLQTNRFSENISDELDEITDKVIAEQANRKPTDPVYWLRQRDVPVITGVEEGIENFAEPTFSFGSFFNQQLMPVWFDFFQAPKQLKFQVLNTKDFLSCVR